mmetsp:Transcript_835/g.3000  ORF Transcript_835/g.3000 Transcript_835/m.3000 type:complete len:325 (+) Transcript_835:201-1175(+)
MDLLGGAYGSDSDGEGDRQEEQGGGGEAVMIESAAKRAKLVGLEGGDAADADFCAYYNYPEKDGDGNYTVSLPLERQNIGRVIGNKGVRIRKITGDTGAKCTIQQPPYGSNWASATLTGTPDAIKAAHALVFQYQQLPAVVPVDGTLKDDPNYKLEVCKDWLNNPKTGCMHAEAPEECFFAHGLKVPPAPLPARSFLWVKPPKHLLATSAQGPAQEEGAEEEEEERPPSRGQLAAQGHPLRLEGLRKERGGRRLGQWRAHRHPGAGGPVNPSISLRRRGAGESCGKGMQTSHRPRSEVPLPAPPPLLPVAISPMQGGLQMHYPG